MISPETSGPPLCWRLGSRPAERLRRCLDEAHRSLPRGCAVAFVSPPGPVEAEYFRWRWAAYLLPDLDVVRLTDRSAGSHHVIAFRLELDRPDLTLIRELPGGGRLYRMGNR